jgi:predicted nucleic acid-binding protein
MSLPNGSRVYIDTMVWVYHLIQPTHRLGPVCERLLKEVASGNLVGVSSTFVIQETTDVAKRIISIVNGKAVSIDETEAVREKILGALLKMGIEIHDADALACPNGVQSNLFKGTEAIIMKSHPVLGTDGKWRTVNGADAVHLTLAERAKADYFATCDQGFRGQNTSVRTSIVWEDYL